MSPPGQDSLNSRRRDSGCSQNGVASVIGGSRSQKYPSLRYDEKATVCSTCHAFDHKNARNTIPTIAAIAMDINDPIKKYSANTRSSSCWKRAVPFATSTKPIALTLSSVPFDNRPGYAIDHCRNHHGREHAQEDVCYRHASIAWICSLSVNSHDKVWVSPTRSPRMFLPMKQLAGLGL